MNFCRQVVAVLKGHQKKVNRVVYHPTEDTAITGSLDTTVRYIQQGYLPTMSFHASIISLSSVICVVQSRY